MQYQGSIDPIEKFYLRKLKKEFSFLNDIVIYNDIFIDDKSFIHTYIIHILWVMILICCDKFVWNGNIEGLI